MLFHHDDVGAEDHLETAAAGDTIDGRDDRFVEITRVIESSEPTHAPVLIRFFTAGGGFQIPAR